MPIETQIAPKVQFGTATEIAAEIVQQAGIFSLDQLGVLRLTKVDLTQVVIGSGVGGSGTANKVAKFTASGTIGDSQITDTGTNITIAAAGVLSTSSANSSSTATGSRTMSSVNFFSLTSSGADGTIQAATNLAISSAFANVNITGYGGVSVSTSQASAPVVISATGTGATISIFANAGVAISATVTGSVAINRLSHPAVTPAALANAAVDNYALCTSSFMRLAGDAGNASEITSIVAQTDGARLTIVNVGTGTIQIDNQSAAGGATAANKIITKTAANVILPALCGSITLQYDATSLRWREV